MQTQSSDSSVLAELVESLRADVLETLEAVRFPAGLIDLDGRVCWQNRASRELLGDVRGRLPASVVAPADLWRAREQFARKLAGSEHTAHEVGVVCADGTRARLEVSSVPLKRADDSVIGVFALGRIAAERDPPVERVSGLTPREREALTHLAAGRSTKQIAELMRISQETVRNHVRRVLRKLDAKSRLEAVANAQRAGLV